MKRATLTTLALLLGSTLLTAIPAAGYHWDDENENSQYMSAAGDDAVIQDGGECFNQTAEIEDTHCVVLYGHVFDLRNTVPMNVQSPATCAPDLAHGFTGDPVHTGQRNHFEMFSSPGFVEYTEENCGGIGQEAPRTHPERALSSDIRIEEEVPIYGYWYLSADHAEFSPLSVNTGPNESSTGVMPCVSVRMQLWTQRYPGTGTLLAEGTTTKTVLSTPGAADDPEAVHGLVEEVCGTATGTIDPQNVTEFEVAMEKQESNLIPDHEAYVISVDWWQHDSGTPDEDPNLMQRDWNLHTGSEYPNRVVMAVKDSIRVDELRLIEFDDRLWIRGSINTPWGSYDVDTENIRLTLHDEQGQEIPLDLDDPIVDYDTDHGGHYKPVNVTYAWDYKDEDLEPGDYTFRLTVTNWQHTKDIDAERTFTLHEDGVDVEKKVDDEEAQESGITLVVPAFFLLLVPLVRALGRRRAA